jgi:hypothetical protein
MYLDLGSKPGEELPDLSQLQFKFRSGLFRKRPQVCHVRRGVRVQRLMVLNRRGKLDQLRENVGVMLADAQRIDNGVFERKNTRDVSGDARGALAHDPVQGRRSEGSTSP